MNQTKLFNKDFTLMTIGQFISLFGNSLQRFALSLLILDITGSAMLFSVIVAVTFIPQILLSPFGGAIADRFNKKWIMVILDSLSCLILLVFFLMNLGATQIAGIEIGILMFLMTIIQSIYDPDVRASIPVITSSNNLASANSVVSIVSSVSGLLGPVAAGFLYGTYGIEIIFLINIISFGCSAIMEVFIQIPHTKAPQTKHILSTFIVDIKDTFHYLSHKKPLILKTILMASGINLFLAPLYSIGMPFTVKILFGISDELYGISEGFVGAGMIIGALLTGMISKKIPFSKLYVYFYGIIVMTAVMGIPILPFLINPNGPSMLSYIIYTITGFFFAVLLAIINIIAMTYMQQMIPMNYMGKSMALVIAISNALYPVGQLIFGTLYDAFSNTAWIIHIIVIICTAVVTIIMRRTLKKETKV